MKHLIFFAVSIGSVYCFPTDNKLSSVPEDSFPIYSRQEWGGVPPTDTRPLKTPVEYVIIHHTYIPAACNTTEECGRAMRSMQNYHNSLGWGDIGYHFCLGSEGGVYEGRGWHTVGIHAGNANSVSVGICLIGDWRVELPPQQMLDTTKALISMGVSVGAVRSDYKLIGHKQAMSTECPGEALMEEISKWSHFIPGDIDFKPKANKLVKH